MYKKIIMVILPITFISISVFAGNVDLSKLDSAGKQVISILYQFAFWGMTVKAMFETLKLGFSGNVKGAVDKAIGYVVLYILFFFIPWLFEIIKGIFC